MPGVTGASGDDQSVPGAWQLDAGGRPVRFWPNPRHHAPVQKQPAAPAAPLPPLHAGRRPAGRALLGWLGDPHAPRLCRIAGSSGSGRTHLLRWLTAACPPDSPRTDRRVDVLLAADGLTPDSFVWQLARELGTTAADVHELIETLTDGVPRVLAVTGLDRAGAGLLPDAPQRIVEKVLGPLLTVPWVRIVVECEASDLFDARAAVLDLDQPQWTDPDAYAQWCASLADHPLPAAALYPSPALALLAARTAPGAPVDPAAPPAQKAETLAEAWWASLPETARAPIVALAAAAGGDVDADLWGALPNSGGPTAVHQAADFVLPPQNGALRVWPRTFADRLALWGPDHPTLRQALLPTAPGPHDSAWLGLVLRHAVRSGTSVVDLLSDPAVLVHADPASVTLAFAAHQQAFADATSPDRLRTGPFGRVGPEREGDPPRRLIEAWWLAGPVVTAAAGPGVRASALHTWLAGAEQPELGALAEQLGMMAGHTWRARWSFGRRIEQVHLLAAGHGPDAEGRLLVGIGRAVPTVDPSTGSLIQGAGRFVLDDPSTVALAAGEDGSAHALYRDGSINSILPEDDSRTATEALVRLRESLEAGATAMAASSGPRPVMVLGDDTGHVHAIPAVDRGEPRRSDTQMHRGPVTAVDVTGYDNEHLVISGGQDGTVWTWMPDRYPMTAPILARDSPVTAVAVATPGQRLMYAAAWEDGLTRVVLTGTDPVTCDLRLGARAVGLAITGAGRLCVATAAGVLGIDLAETTALPSGGN
ncbi:hypothetical protein GCM10010195_72450 [Kitasatospora griseola]|nr:hypothetical protein GCM10010195_72450 [Kitasatospora griseola]